MHSTPQLPRLLSVLSDGSVVVDSLLIVATIVGLCIVPSAAVRYIVSNISCAIILMGKRELVALLCLSSWCHVIIV